MKAIQQGVKSYRRGRRKGRRPRPRELTVLVHGLAASPTMLRPLQASLQEAGYQTLNWSYPSIRGEIDTLSEELARRLGELDSAYAIQHVHLVTHGMGSILARAALANFSFSRLKRVVMLGPPHAGSHVATRLAAFLGGFCRPLHQLSDRPESLVNRLPAPSGYEIGIIAAARDRVVRVENTMLASQTDHIVVDSGHTSMLFRKDVARQVINFLQEGRFSQLVDDQQKSTQTASVCK